MRAIVHRHRTAALAAERIYYAAHIEVLEPEHPERRFVDALFLYSHAVDTREAGRPRYEQSEAERFARALLRPGRRVRGDRRSSDVELAEVFGAPLDHVALRRRDCSCQ